MPREIQFNSNQRYSSSIQNFQGSPRRPQKLTARAQVSPRMVSFLQACAQRPPARDGSNSDQVLARSTRAVNRECSQSTTDASKSNTEGPRPAVATSRLAPTCVEGG